MRNPWNLDFIEDISKKVLKNLIDENEIPDTDPDIKVLSFHDIERGSYKFDFDNFSFNLSYGHGEKLIVYCLPLSIVRILVDAGLVRVNPALPSLQSK